MISRIGDYALTSVIVVACGALIARHPVEFSRCVLRRFQERFS